MHRIRLLVTIALMGLVLTSCNINPSKKAQTRQYVDGGSSAPNFSGNSLKRGYDYYEWSEEVLINRMRNP